jgi:hypothetical protein
VIRHAVLAPGVVLLAACSAEEKATSDTPADLVIHDRNQLEIPASEISNAQVVMTIFDGRIVYPCKI